MPYHLEIICAATIFLSLTACGDGYKSPDLVNGGNHNAENLATVGDVTPTPSLANENILPVDRLDQPSDPEPEIFNKSRLPTYVIGIRG